VTYYFFNKDERFDTRICARLTARGRVTPEEHKAYLDALPDSADQARNSDVRFAYSGGRRRIAYTPSTDND
jgi:hypothetical protein